MSLDTLERVLSDSDKRILLPTLPSTRTGIRQTRSNRPDRHGIRLVAPRPASAVHGRQRLRGGIKASRQKTLERAYLAFAVSTAILLLLTSF